MVFPYEGLKRPTHAYSKIGGANPTVSTGQAATNGRSSPPPLPPSRLNRGLEPGWNTTLKAGGIVIAVVLSLNTALLVASYLNLSSDDPALGTPGFATIFFGSCEKSKAITTGSHLLINVLGSLLLAASAAAMQILSAPTRAEVDRAHTEGKWLDIGLLSVRNLRVIPRKRVVLWLILALSSIPLHLLYNSVVFQSVGINDWVTLLGSQNTTTTEPVWGDHIQQLVEDDLGGQGMHEDYDTFEQDGCDDWGYCSTQVTSNATSTLNKLRAAISAGNLTRMDREECEKTFASGLIQGYSAVVLVTNFTNFNSSAILGHLRTVVAQRPTWTADDRDPIDWQRDQFRIYYKYSNGSDGGIYLPFKRYNLTNVELEYSVPFYESFDIEYCLAQLEPQSCSVQVSQGLLITVIVANLIKLVTIWYVILFLNHRPLVTIGDAVVSFLQHPDPVTNDFGPITLSDVHAKRRNDRPPRGRKRSSRSNRESQKHWIDGRPRWFKAASRKRWLIATGLCVLAVLVGAIVSLADIASSNMLNLAWQSGFGSVSTENQVSLELGTVTSVLLANAPQLIISNVYVFYNGLVTSMLLASEFMDFAIHAKSMRVSPTARGSQRSTYYLQVPLKYGLPLMAIMALLHWAVSQSFFLIHLDAFTMDQTLVKAGYLVSVGFSLQAIVVSLALGSLITSIPIAFGFRRFPAGIPNVGHCSLAISAACHPKRGEPPDASEKKLKYGVLPEVGPSNRRRVGFSSEHVEPLVDGEIYEQSRREHMLLRPADQAGMSDSIELEDMQDTRAGPETQKLQPLISSYESASEDREATK